MKHVQLYDGHFLRLLRLAPFERRRGGWRFGSKRIGDAVVARLVAAGTARTDGATVWIDVSAVKP